MPSHVVPHPTANAQRGKKRRHCRSSWPHWTDPDHRKVSAQLSPGANRAIASTRTVMMSLGVSVEYVMSRSAEHSRREGGETMLFADEVALIRPVALLLGARWPSKPRYWRFGLLL